MSPSSAVRTRCALLKLAKFFQFSLQIIGIPEEHTI
jgi:hypothetical protein